MKIILLLAILSFPAHAQLQVVATTTDLRAVTQAIGQSKVNVESIVKGSQDPHYLEAKPSYMTKVSKADLVIANGLELEVAWLPLVIQGARNPKLAQGKPGLLEVGDPSTTLELPKPGTSRADGDVHPFGNPHITLDPIRLGAIGLRIAERLGDLDGPNRYFYLSNAKKLEANLTLKTKEWQERIKKSGHSGAVSYHKTLTYFFDRFGLKNPAILEPKPGVPPTSSHVLEVIKIMKAQKLKLVMVENYFDASIANKIKESIPDVRIVSVPVSVEGAPGIAHNIALYEALVRAVEGK